MDIYAVRVKPVDNTHPTYIGPLTLEEAKDLGARLKKAGRSYEAALLYMEENLPGLFESTNGDSDGSETE